VVTNLRSKKLEKDGKSLHDDVVTLKTAIEEAINKGQKSLAVLNDIPAPSPISNKDFALARTNAGSRTAGWA
jgi:hypothetical protein